MIPIIKYITRNTVKFCLWSSSAKRLYYNKLISNCNNKPNTIWNIVKTITNNKNTTNNSSIININDKLSSNPLATVNAFNSYFYL